MNEIKIIKAETDLRDEIINALGAPLPGSNQYKNIHPCPFHAEKTVGAFQVTQERYKCWSCGASGDVLDFWSFWTSKTLKELLAEYGNIDQHEAAAKMAEIERRAAEARAAVDAERARQLEKLHQAEKHILYHDALRESAEGQQYWRARGINEDWQAYWQLGYSKGFRYRTSDGIASTNTLAIPVKKVGGEVVTIRHRLLNSINGDKYRPDIAGLGAHPFICNTDLERAKDLIIVEGEIKAMVTFSTWNARGMQVIGVPSKSMMADYIRMSRGRNAIVIPDPDGAQDVVNVCKETGARLLRLPDKVDDFINKYGLSSDWLHTVVNQARRA